MSAIWVGDVEAREARRLASMPGADEKWCVCVCVCVCARARARVCLSTKGR